MSVEESTNNEANPSKGASEEMKKAGHGSLDFSRHVSVHESAADNFQDSLLDESFAMDDDTYERASGTSDETKATKTESSESQGEAKTSSSD